MAEATFSKERFQYFPPSNPIWHFQVARRIVVRMVHVPRRWVLWLCLILTVLGLALLLAPSAYWKLRGLANGEHFFTGMPTSYWSRRVEGFHKYQDKWADSWSSKIPDFFGLADWDYPAVMDGDPEAIPVLVDLLDANEAGVRIEAVRTLTEFVVRDPSPEMKIRLAPYLLGALGNDDLEVRWHAAIGLGDVGRVNDEIVPALLQVLRDPPLSGGERERLGIEHVRWGAVTALAQIGVSAEELLPALSHALVDASPEFTAYALETAAQVGPDAVPLLVEALRDSRAPVRRAAAKALAVIGPEAKEALPALLTSLHDQDADVRQAAAEAMKVIDPSAARMAGIKQNRRLCEHRPSGNRG